MLPSVGSLPDPAGVGWSSIDVEGVADDGHLGPSLLSVALFSTPSGKEKAAE
jgi:hypothetical protein